MVDNQISPQKKFSTDLDPDIGETTEVSWVPPKNLTYEKWEQIGATLQTVNRSVKFWLGDWLNAGEAKYGESYTQAIIMTDSALETLKKYKAIAQRISVEDRIADLSWTHHFTVAYLPQDEHKPLLQLADFHGLTSRQFRQVIELPDEERAHLIDLWVNFDDQFEHTQTLMALRTMEKFGTIYLPDEEEDEDNDDGTDQDGESEETEDHQVILDGDEYKYETNAGDKVYEFWENIGMPLVHTDQKQAEWKGIRVVAILDEDGDPLLLWDMVSVT